MLILSATDECLRAFLPEELRDGAPTGFAMIGHIGMYPHVQFICFLDDISQSPRQLE